MFGSCSKFGLGYTRSTRKAKQDRGRKMDKKNQMQRKPTICFVLQRVTRDVSVSTNHVFKYVLNCNILTIVEGNKCV